LAESARYIAYAPWRKSSIDIIKREEPFYKDGKTSMTKFMTISPENTKSYILMDPLFWADNNNNISSNWDKMKSNISKGRYLAKKEFDKIQNLSEKQITNDINIEEDNSIGTKLKNLAKLYKDGVLDKTQFEKAKKKLLNFENTGTAKSTQPVSYDWVAIAKHPKSNNEFVATRLSTKKKAIDLAIKKCYQFVTNSLSKRGYNDCSIVQAYNEKEEVKTLTAKAEPSQTQKVAKKDKKIDLVFCRYIPKKSKSFNGKYSGYANL